MPITFMDRSTRHIKPRPLQHPTVYFLFMLGRDGVVNSRLWAKFFEGAPRGLWQIFMHDSRMGGRRAASTFDASMGAIEVATQPSYWCTDLVTPMNALLAEAMRQHKKHPHPNDKFVFLAGDHLPVKSFHRVYAALTEAPESLFCILPTSRWSC